jgi:hypothetical protein
VSRELLVQLFASGHAELKPGANTGEFAFQGLTYTGLDINATPKSQRCESFSTSPANEFGERVRTCTRVATFSRLIALDHLRINFAGPAGVLQTALPPNGGFPGTPLVAPPYLPAGGTVTGTSFVWDAGNDDLPGPQH